MTSPLKAADFRLPGTSNILPFTRRASVLVAVLTFLLTPRASYSQDTIPNADDRYLSYDRETLMMAPPGPVVAVRFQGNKALSEDELASITATQVTGMFSRFLYNYTLGIFKFSGSPYQTLDYSTLQRDTAELTLHYKDNGFLLAHVSFRVTPDAEGLREYNDYIRRVRLTTGGGKNTDVPVVKDTVTFIVHEGPEFTISRIAVAGLESLPLEFQPELTENVTIKSGVRWSRTVAAKEVERLSTLMVERGYPNFRFDPIVVEHLQGKTNVNVLLYFTPGHRYRYGSVHIDYDSMGASKHTVAERVVRAQLQFESGKWFRFSDIQRSEQNLYKLGTFDLVRVSLDTNAIQNIPDSLRDSTAVPVQVYLRMKLSGEIPVGVYGGAGTDGFVLGANAALLWHNFTRIADYFNLQLSYQFFPLTQRLYSGSIDYFMPYSFAWGIPLSLGLGTSRQSHFSTESGSYDQLSISSHLGTTIYSSTQDNRSAFTPDVLVEYLVTTGDPNAPARQVNLLPSVNYQDDRTNDPINPTAGRLFTASLEYGVPSDLFAIFGSNYPSSAYWKFTPQLRLYHDLSSTGRTVIAGRVRFGITQMQTSDTQRVPSLNHRFFAGGATSNRGWPEQSMIVTDNPNRDSRSGGYDDIEGNLEIRYAPFQYEHEYTYWQRVLSPFRVVIFYDIGNVFDDAIIKTLSSTYTELSQTIGFGIRYNLFFGALRVDVGFKLYDPQAGTHGYQTGSQSILPTDKGAWLSGNPFRLGRTMNIQFGLGQAF